MQHIWGKIQIYYFWNRDCCRAIGFGNLIVPREVLVKLFSNTILFFLQEWVTATWFPPPSSVTARWEAYSTLNLYYIRRSWNLVRRLLFERDTVGNMHIFAYVGSYLFWIVHIFWTARVCVDGFSLHGLLRSEIVSASPPCCSPNAQSSCQDVYSENSGEVLPKFVSDRSRAWKLTPSTHTRVGLGPIFTQQLIYMSR